MRCIASPYSAPPDRFQRLKHKQYGHARQRRDSQQHRFHRCETEEIASGLPEQRCPHRPQHEMQFQAEDPEDPSIIYRVADAHSRHLLREVLPLGTGPSTKGR